MSIETQERVQKIQKIIASTGMCSHRHADEMVRAGRVTINGAVAQLGARADSATDQITVDGDLIPQAQRRRYMAFYKPAKVVTTLRDPEGRPTIAKMLEAVPERVYPIGRMDYNSEGLMLVTNDGDLAHHGTRRIDQVCRVRLSAPLNAAQEQRFRNGMELPCGSMADGIGLELIQPGKHPLYELRWKEASGRNIRPMFKMLGVYIDRMIRVQLGPISLGAMSPGTLRDLSPCEVQALREA